MLLDVCYRVPGTNEEMDNGLCRLIDAVAKENTIIMGDFNHRIKSGEAWRKTGSRHFFNAVTTISRHNLSKNQQDDLKYWTSLVHACNQLRM